MSNYSVTINPFDGQLQLVSDSSLLRIKGVVATTANLPLSGNVKNDAYIVTADSCLYIWNSDLSTGTLVNWINAGSIVSTDWSSITNKPASPVEDIDAAVTHSKEAHAPSNAVSLATVKADSDVSDAISKKHSNSLDHIQGTDQALDTGGANAVTAVQTKTAYTHSQATHAPTDAVSLAAVKADVDIADAISKKHSNSLDHASHSDDQDLSGLLPYTGATTDLQLGNHSATIKGITNTGAANKNKVIVTNTYIVLSTDELIVCNKSSAFTVTLPVASGSGRTLEISNINTGTITIDGNNSDTIDGETTQSLLQYESVILIDYSANAWVIV